MEIIKLPLSNLINTYLENAQNNNILNLKEGTIVPASLVEIFGDSYGILQISGINFRAKLNADLSIGDMVNLLVTGNSSDNALELKLINKINDTVQNQENVNIDELLQTLKLPYKQEARTLVKALLEQGLPVNPETLKNLLITSKQISSMNISSNTLLNIIKLDIPILPETLTAIETLQNNYDTKNMLNDLKASIQKLLGSSNNQHFTDKLSQLLVKLENNIGKILSESLLSNTLNEKLSLLGLDYENKIAQIIHNDLRGNRPENGILNNSLDKYNSTLKSLLLALKNSSEFEAVGGSKFVKQIDTLLNHLVGQQLVTESLQNNSGQLYSFFSLPLSTNETMHTVEFQVMSKSKAGSKEIDPLNCYVLMHMELPSLGELDVHMNIIEKNISLRFVTGQCENFLLVDRLTLTNALKEIGFNLELYKIEERSTKDSRLNVFPPILSYQKLDMKI